MKKRTYTIVLALAVLILAVFLFWDNEYSAKNETKNTDIPEMAKEKESEEIGENNIVPEKVAVEAKDEKLPEKIWLDVPFVPQAPFQKWDALHEDACEEASVLTVKHFYARDRIVPKELAEEEIQEMVKYEEKNGYGPSITLQELSKLANDYLGMKTGRVEKNIKIENIKKELIQKHPVIVGAAGKILPNPNFRNGGPNYHMLVIIGYDQNGFITNDPGTRLGENFKYTFNGLYNAIHDWNEKNILSGEKNFLVFD